MILKPHLAEVVALRDVNESAVALLERALEDARSGEITSVAIACTQLGSNSSSGYSTSPERPLLIGAVTLLQAKLIACVLDDAK